MAALPRVRREGGERQMNLSDWCDLNERAEEHGLGDDPSLTQLLHILQFKEVVVRGHRRTMDELNAWEKNIAKDVERSIEAEEAAERRRGAGVMGDE